MSTVVASARSTEAFSELVNHIYDAALRPERWTKVMAAIAASFDTDKGLLFTPYVAPHHGGMVFPAGISEATLQLWASSYIEHDIWSQDVARRRLWKTGEVLLDKQMVPHRTLLQSRFYREFLVHIDIARVCTGFVFENASGLMAASMAVFRGARDRPFNNSDVAWMRLLVPHVSRSLGVMQRLESARLHNASLLASFDRLSFGVILLDHDLRAIHSNCAAKAVLKRQDGLTINDQGYLESVMTKTRGDSPLLDWLGNMKKLPHENPSHFSESIRLRRASLGHYDLQCSAIYPTAVPNSHDARFIVFVTDPSALQLPDATRLCEIFGLTRAQSRVALALAGGATYREAAKRLRVSEETIRSHVKELYPKVRVNRQADLVRLVLALGQSGV